MTDNFQQILQMGQQVQARLSQLQAELGAAHRLLAPAAAGWSP